MNIDFDKYKIWKKLLQQRINRSNVIEELTIANLCGRYGTSIATSLNIITNNHAHQKYILCNADEGEPGTFKDRHIMLTDPHQLIEGIAIVGATIGATIGYIYIRGEFLEPIAIMKKALIEAYNANFLGKNIFKSGYDFDLHITHGAGSYICGEETAMIESIEGNKGLPRFKPPWTTSVGLYGCPTGVYNVETLANIPDILEQGGKNWNNCKMFSVSGHVNKPGVYKLPLGTAFKDLLAMVGGIKNNKKLKAVMPGGLSSPIIPAEVVMQLHLDYQSLTQAGSMLGSCGLIIMDETTCMVEILLRIAKFYMDESCGKCSPCREGTGWIYRIVNKIYNGYGSLQDLEVLEHISSNINNTICGLGTMASMSVKSFIKHFKQEFIEKIQLGTLVHDQY